MKTMNDPRFFLKCVGKLTPRLVFVAFLQSLKIRSQANAESIFFLILLQTALKLRMDPLYDNEYTYIFRPGYGGHVYQP